MKPRLFSALLVLTAMGATGVILAQDPPPEVTPEAVPEATAEPTAVTEYPGAQWVEAGGLRFLLPGAVANGVTESQVEAVPLDPNVMFAASYPAHARVDFTDYLPDDAPEITHDFQVPPVMYVFDTADFAAFEDENGFGYPSQAALLQGIIDGTIRRTADTPEPYLPMVGAAQVLHAREQVVTFRGGKGLVYLATFAQDVAPVIEGRMQFVFQGLTDDGSTYISAIFPVDTNMLPDDYDPNMDYEAFSAGYLEYIATTREALEAQPAEAFAPSLDALTALVGSIEVIK